MNAKATFPQIKALSSSTTGSQMLLSASTSRGCETKSSGNLDADQITLRATKMTVVLKNILKHSCYTHGGLNE